MNVAINGLGILGIAGGLGAASRTPDSRRERPPAFSLFGTAREQGMEIRDPASIVKRILEDVSLAKHLWRILIEIFRVAKQADMLLCEYHENSQKNELCSQLIKLLSQVRGIFRSDEQLKRRGTTRLYWKLVYNTVGLNPAGVEILQQVFDLIDQGEERIKEGILFFKKRLLGISTYELTPYWWGGALNRVFFSELFAKALDILSSYPAIQNELLKDDIITSDRPAEAGAADSAESAAAANAPVESLEAASLSATESAPPGQEVLPPATSTFQKPKKWLYGWQNIIDVIGADILGPELTHEQRVSRLRRLNKQYDGPIIPGKKGQQPLVEETALLEWWNSLNERYENSQQRLRDAEATVSVQYPFGDRGTVCPDINGGIKQRV